LKGAAEYEHLVDLFAALRCDVWPTCRAYNAHLCSNGSCGREFIPEIARTQRDIRRASRDPETRAIIVDPITGDPVIHHGAITNPDIPIVFKQARIGMNAQSVAHLLIILFIVLGNIGYFVQKYKTNKES